MHISCSAVAACHSLGTEGGFKLDLKGVLYNAAVLPLAGTALVVNIGPTDAKARRQSAAAAQRNTTSSVVHMPTAPMGYFGRLAAVLNASNAAAAATNAAEAATAHHLLLPAQVESVISDYVRLTEEASWLEGGTTLEGGLLGMDDLMAEDDDGAGGAVGAGTQQGGACCCTRHTGQGAWSALCVARPLI